MTWQPHMFGAMQQAGSSRFSVSTNYSTPSASQEMKQFAIDFAAIGLTVAGGVAARAAERRGEGEAPTPSLQQRTDAAFQEKIGKAEAEVANAKAELKAANLEYRTYANLPRSDEAIKAKETELENFMKQAQMQKENTKTELNDKHVQIKTVQAEITKTTSDYTSAQTEYANEANKPADLRQQAAEMRAGGDDAKAQDLERQANELETNHNNKTSPAGVALTKAETAKTQAEQNKAKLLQEQNITEQQYNEAVSNLETFDAKSKEIEDAKLLQKTRQEAYTQALARKETAEIDLKQREDDLQTLKDEYTQAKGKIKLDESTSTQTMADTKGKRGNWWKRNMPSWLGGSKAAQKAEYRQNNRDYHQASDNLKETHGLSKKEIKDMRVLQQRADKMDFGDNPTPQSAAQKLGIDPSHVRIIGGKVKIVS